MSRSAHKDVHVLSFDGGGCPGLMEYILLDDIMNLTTVMVRNPENIIILLDKLDTPDAHTFAKFLLKNIEGNPIHPTDAFQYIVGKFMHQNSLLFF